MSYNDLIADYIIKQGIELTSEFNYSIGLDDLEEDFDNKLFTYVKNNMDDIFNSVSSDERVAEVILTDNSFDMVFYWGYCLDENDDAELRFTSEMMRDVFYGIRVKEFILFYEDDLQYYIIEDHEGEVNITESNNILVDECANQSSSIAAYN